MFIESVSIENYKSFFERQTLLFEPGFNLLIGANNSGKTTVLEVFDLTEGVNEPHRSSRNTSNYGIPAAGGTKCEVAVVSDLQELRRLTNRRSLALPVQFAISNDAPDYKEAFLKRLSRPHALRLRGEFGRGLDALTFNGPDSIRGRVSINPADKESLAAYIFFGEGDATPQLHFSRVDPSAMAGYWQAYRQSISLLSG